MLALWDSAKRKNSAAYNLGRGHSFSVREVIHAVERATGLKVPVILGEPRAGDPPELVSDAQKGRIGSGGGQDFGT